jgi:hypothetical protein
MKFLFFSVCILLSSLSIAQNPSVPDTIRMNMGKMEVILIDHSMENKEEPMDTIDAAPTEEEVKRLEAHWAGFDFGFTTLLNESNTTEFSSTPYWRNDPVKSMVFNLNLFERKLSIWKNYVGITTGAGLSFAQIGLRNNYTLLSTADSLFAVIPADPTDYKKNKLKATYVTIPVLLEFCDKVENESGFFLAVGVVGGVRIASSYKRKTEDSKDVKRSSFDLNSFKLDATARIGFGSWGAFANYSLLPVFNTDKTVPVFPFSFGLSRHFN